MRQEMTHYLERYLRERPIFLSAIRSAEAAIYSRYLPLKASSLDIGCGDGFFARTVFGSFDVGIDLPGSRMDQAKERHIYGSLFEFDGVHIPLKSRSIQAAVSNCVLEHVADLPGLLGEIRRVLVPGGELMVTVMTDKWEEHLIGGKIAGRWYIRRMRKAQEHRNLLSSAGWRKAFAMSGFRVKDAVGYLGTGQSRMIELAHYLSVGSLVSYKLLGNWVPMPFLQTWLAEPLSGVMGHTVPEKESAAVFYRLGVR